MVQAIICISDESNQVINVIKAKYGLKDKSEAVDLMAKQYNEIILEPQLRPEYVKKIEKISKEKTINVKNIEGLKARYG
jgi:hypothetical protein